VFVGEMEKPNGIVLNTAASGSPQPTEIIFNCDGTQADAIVDKPLETSFSHELHTQNSTSSG
jgi:hypothetical protein